MNETFQQLAEQYAAAFQEYLSESQEAGLMHAYDLVRRALTLEMGVADLGIAHGRLLAAALPDGGTPEARAELIQRAAEFLGEAMAPFAMILRGYREANAGLRRLSETLEQRVTERTEALRRSAEDLREASRRKDEFLAQLAHDLRNPLAPIRNALHVLRLTRFDAAKVDQARDLMERQVQHLARLIEDLMDVARLGRGKVELRKERLDLATVVQSALEISRPHLEAARHALTVELPPAPVAVYADAARLTQVVVNLLNNASKYTEPGGSIWLTAERQGAHAVVRVRDTGIGIPPEMLPDVFDLFVQAPAALGRAQGGLGIGLTLAKRLVEMHGGSIEAQSAGARQGSEFIVRLPLAPEEPASQEPDPDVPEHSPPGR
jgi:signal transduction histidine kinase